MVPLIPHGQVVGVFLALGCSSFDSLLCMGMDSIIVASGWIFVVVYCNMIHFTYVLVLSFM